MKGSPFKLRSPLKVEGTINMESATTGQKVSYGDTSKKTDLSQSTVDGHNIGINNDTDGDSAAETLEKQLEQAGKSTGESAFDRDGRSVDKFNQRIADAESKGKLGRVQRLRNRKSGYMESQANKFERAGGTLNNQQKTDLNKATEESGGTRFGKALRAFGGRDAKIREVDPIIAPKEKKDNNQGREGSF
jgi:hypothetical protein